MANCWEVKNLSFTFKKGLNNVLSDINLKIEEGQWITFFGNNGSGKSTLLKLLANLCGPYEGEIIYAGKNLHNWDKGLFHQKVGWLGQHTANQIITTSVEEELAFGLENLGLPREEIHQRIEETLQEWQMEELREHPPHLLSGGQQQKLALASLFSMHYSSLLLDEPFNFLDEVAERHLTKKIKEAVKKGVTVITTTPETSHLLYADKVIALDNGKKVFDGKPEEIFAEKIFWQKWPPPVLWDIGMHLYDLGYLPGFIFSREEELVQAYVDHFGKSQLSV